MKKILVMALALMMVLSLVACGGKDDPKPSGNDTPSTSQQTGQPSNTPDDSQPSGGEETPSGGEEIDLSQFTPVDVPDWELIEDWMIPDFGVITKTEEMIPNWTYAITVSGVTSEDVENYKKVLEENGLTAGAGTTYSNDKLEIALATQSVGTTASSYMPITISKK